MKLVLAIDIGTSSVRAGLVDEALTIRSVASRPCPLSTPKPGWAQHPAEPLLEALDEAVRECLGQEPPAGRILGIALDAAMHTVVLLDERGDPLSPIWTWADMRAAPQAARLAQDPARARRLYLETGCPPHATYHPARIRWLAEHEPGLLHRARTIASVKALVLHRLTGELAEDLSTASASGLLNVSTLAWHPEVLEITGVREDRLPRLVEPKSPVGILREALARRWGTGAIPVVAGGTDGPMANVGAGCAGPGEAAVTAGTSSAVRMLVDGPTLDVKMRTWCYYLGDGTWIAGGAVNAGGGTLDWLSRSFPGELGGQPASGRLDQLAGSVPPGAEGLFFAPYLAGERSPGWQDTARGYLAGLGLHHRFPHLVRAAMEGIAYQIASVFHSLAETAGEPRRVRVSGGLFSSRVFPQILADVLGRTLEVPATPEGSLLGTAALGFAALEPGVDWRELARRVAAPARIEPDPARHREYRRLFAAYQELYQAMRPLFRPLASL